MSRQPIIQIVPRLGSLIDGVADHARALAAALDANEGMCTWFLSGDPDDGPAKGEWQDRSSKVAERSPTALISAVEDIASRQDSRTSPNVLLHYVNYGYAPRGCPFWLVRGLMALKRRKPGVRLVTMFHELYAFGAPWRSSFWLSPVQRHLVRQVWALTDAAVTNVGRYRRQLCNWQPGDDRRVALMPVFSSIGEPCDLVPWNQRRSLLVVFARPEAADRAYGRCREKLLRACRLLEVRDIVDIGARSGPVPSRIEDVTVSALGHLPAADVSAILGQARAGFLDYPSDHLGKSTIFAAYAAHGLVPVITCRRGEEEPGLVEGANYWSPARAANAARRDFESIAKEACAWYAGHRLDLQVREFARKLGGEGDAHDQGGT